MGPFIRIENRSTLTIDIPHLYIEMVLSPFFFFCIPRKPRDAGHYFLYSITTGPLGRNIPEKNDTRKTLMAPNFHQLPRFVEKTTSIPQPFTVFSTESSFPWPKKQGHKTWPSAHQPRFSGDFTISEGKNVEHTLFSFHGVPEVEKLVESWSAWSIGGVWFCNKFQMSWHFPSSLSISVLFLRWWFCSVIQGLEIHLFPGVFWGGWA